MDLESPLCLDLELMNRHFTDLSEGKRIFIPKYDFCRQMRTQEPSKSIKLKKDEMVVYEGIHALNPELTSKISKDVKFSIYISPLTVLNIDEDNRIPMTDLRLLRRMARDIRSRDRSAAVTLRQWPDVRSGEEKNIFPYIGQSDTLFNSTLTYELIRPRAAVLFC